MCVLSESSSGRGLTLRCLTRTESGARVAEERVEEITSVLAERETEYRLDEISKDTTKEQLQRRLEPYMDGCFTFLERG